jgi:hypothetical protein
MDGMDGMEDSDGSDGKDGSGDMDTGCQTLLLEAS